MINLLLANLAKNQAFASALRLDSPIDTFAREALHAVMFQKKEGVRQDALAKLESKSVAYFRDSVQPASRAQGAANARDVLRKLTGIQKADTNDADLRRKILLDGQHRAKARLEIFRVAVNDRANTLDNRLAAFWLEPGENDSAKLAHLRALHNAMEEKRKGYELKLRDFYAGKIPERPTAPRLDYMSKFTAEVKVEAMTGARRTGTDAELETFVKAGEARFSWVTVNASEACKDCKERQGLTGDVAYFDQLGRPGSGKTVCGAKCFCMLVPARSLTQFPALQNGLTQPPRSPLPNTIP